MKKFCKLFLSAVISSSLLLSATSVFANTEESVIRVEVQIGNNVANVNGTDVTIDAAPYIQAETNSTMIPLRFVATALNIPESNIKFDANTKTVTITKDNDVVEFQVNASGYKKNGVAVDSSSNSIVEIKDDRTFVPFRTLATAFDLDILWESDTKTAVIQSQPTSASDAYEVSATDSARAMFDLFVLGDTTNAISKIGLSESECKELSHVFANGLTEGFVAGFGYELSNEKIEELLTVLKSTFSKINYTVSERDSADGKKIVTFKTTYIDFDEILENTTEKFVKEVVENKVDESKLEETLVDIFINEIKNYTPSENMYTFEVEYSVDKYYVNGELVDIWMPSDPDDFMTKIDPVAKMTL